MGACTSKQAKSAKQLADKQRQKQLREQGASKQGADSAAPEASSRNGGQLGQARGQEFEVDTFSKQPRQLSQPMNQLQLPVFQELDVSTFQDQSKQAEFEQYFVRACVQGNEQILMDIIDHNHIETRATVVSLMQHDQQMTLHQPAVFAQKQQQQYPFIENVTHLSLYRQYRQPIPLQTKSKVWQNINCWNPVLVMIGKNYQSCVEKLLLTRTSEYLHLGNTLSKCYSIEKQAQVAFAQNRRIKRECFALKLAIYNRNENMLKFLINGSPQETQMSENPSSDQLSQIWNFGHVIQALRYMIKTNWKEGIRKLFSLRRVKQIFLSINETKGFLDALHILIEMFLHDRTQNPEDMKHMRAIFLDQIDEAPYVLAKILIGLYVQLPQNEIQELIQQKFDRHSMPFFHHEIESIFRQFDPENLHGDVLKQIQDKCELERSQNQSQPYSKHDHLTQALGGQKQTQEADVKRAILQVGINVKDMIRKSKVLQGGQTLDDDACEQLIDDMDALHPFPYKIGVGSDDGSPGAHGADNLVQMILQTGNEQLIDFLYSYASDCNIKSLLIQSPVPQSRQQSDYSEVNERKLELRDGNRYEILNQIPLIDVQFFKHLLQQQTMDRLKLTFKFVLDQLQLRNVFDLIKLIAKDEDLGVANQVLLIGYIFQNKKFISLFHGSLEMQKFNFIETLTEVLEDEEIFDERFLPKGDSLKVKNLIKSNQYLQEYHNKIKAGDHGDQFLKPTQLFLVEQHKKGADTIIYHTLLDNQDAVGRQYSGVNPSANYTFSASEMRRKISLNEDEEEKNVASLDREKSKNRANTAAFDEEEHERKSEESIDSEEDRKQEAMGYNQRMAMPKEPQAVSKTIESQSIGGAPNKRDAQNTGQNDGQTHGPYDYGVLVAKPQAQARERPPEVTRNQQVQRALPPPQSRPSVESERRSDRMAQQLDPGEIELQFEPLNRVHLSSEISMAYSEIIEGLHKNFAAAADPAGNNDHKLSKAIADQDYEEIPSSRGLTVDDLQEVLAGYSLNPFEHIQINQSELEEKDENEDDSARDGSPSHQVKVNEIIAGKSLWNVLLFAIWYDQTAIVEFLLTSDEYSSQLDPMAIRKPPANNQEYHLMGKHQTTPTPGRPGAKGTGSLHAITMAAANRNLEILCLIIDNFAQSLTCLDLCEIARTLVGEPGTPECCQWQEGMQAFLKSAVTKRLFVHLRPEDRELFIATSLMEPIVQALKSEGDSAVDQAANPASSQNYQSYLKMVIKELRSTPYQAYSVLRYPHLFQKFGALPKSLAAVTDNEIILFLHGEESNLEKLKRYSVAYEQKKSAKQPNIMARIREIISIAEEKQANQEMIEPFDPSTMLGFIRNGDLASFERYFEGLKERAAQEPGAGSEEVCLVMYMGRQIAASDQVADIEFIPQDEAIQQLLFDIDDDTLSRNSGSMNSDEHHMRIMNLLRTKVIQTESWNPLIFAIYYGQIDIVKYILSQTSTQQLYYLLSDPFKADQSTEDDDQLLDQDKDGEGADSDPEFILERSELLPLVLCLITKNGEMLSLLWNQTMLWNKHIYLIILGNFVFETNTPDFIRRFLLADKTKKLFNSISLCEKQKFLQFTIKSLENQIIDDNESQQDIGLGGSNYDEEEQAATRMELEKILNVEMLSQPPYSLVNLTENLLPLNMNSTVDNLLGLIEQYRQSPEGLEILELTLKNLQGDAESVAFSQKWVLINCNQIWAKKLCSLIIELGETHPDICEEFRCISLLKEDIFEDFQHVDESEIDDQE